MSSGDTFYRGPDHSKIFDILVEQVQRAIDSGRVKPVKMPDGNGRFTTEKGILEVDRSKRTFTLDLPIRERYLLITDSHSMKSLSVYTFGLPTIQSKFIFPVGNAWLRSNLSYFFGEWLRIMQEEPWENREGKFDSLLQQFIREQRERQLILAKATHKLSVNSPLHGLPQDIYQKVRGMTANERYL